MPRRTTAPARRATTAPLRGAAAISMRRSQLSHGFSTAFASSRSSAWSVILALAATCSLLLRRKWRMNLSVSPLFATLALPCTDHCRCSCARLRSTARWFTYVAYSSSACRRAVSRSARYAAQPPAYSDALCACSSSSSTLVIVRSRNDRSWRHDHRAAREIGAEKALEPVETGEVEVVRRLVEEEHVEAREQDRGEVGARGLAAGERVHVEVEHPFGQPEIGGDLADAGIEVGGAEREVRVERARVRVVGAHVRRSRERLARRLERALGVARRRCGARGTRARSRPAGARGPAGR